MTDLAHDCALLKIGVDTGRLYDGDDPHYEIWLSALRDRVAATRRRVNETNGN